MTQAKSTQYMLTNQGKRNQSQDGTLNNGADRSTMRSSSSAILRRGSAPDLCDRLLPPIDDGKTNRSFSPLQSSYSPIANQTGLVPFERKINHNNANLFSKYSPRLSACSISLSSEALSRNSSNPSIVNHTLAGQANSTNASPNYRAASLTGLSPVPPDLVTTRNHGIPEIKTLKQTPSLVRRRHVSEKHSSNCKKKESCNNHGTYVGLKKSNTETNILNHRLRKNTTPKLRTLPTTTSDSQLTPATLQGINNSQYDNESNSSDQNDTRIIEWLLGVETNSVNWKDGAGHGSENDGENNNIQETAIRIVYEDP
ncbi:uncharacterized protein LOC117113751 [Anneissia japonica]|uniref:uncharacterized protein LOC117113751 n=1 Tax=Anneissia japonica TaxID=1529436 RepID=UPI00142599AA|nr:uncharacterized protein LOC117113751 [Anneissia japonica]XP_033113087.1 uncharacterized protein LOC117113751 [Anneissia japonica]